MAAPTTLSEEAERLLAEKVKAYVEGSDKINFNAEKVREDIAAMMRRDRIAAKKGVATLDTIRGDDDVHLASRILQRFQRRRSKLAHMKVSINDAFYTLKKLRDEARDLLYQSEELTGLRNEMLRSAAVSKILGRLQDRYHDAKHCLEQIDILTWEIKDNQRAVEYQVLLYKEAVWEAKHGVG